MTSRGAYKPRRAVKVPSTLGQRIQAARRGMGMTQANLAATLGVPQQSVSSWERDLSEPSSLAMAALVRFFGISEGTFRTGNDFEVPFLPRTGWLDDEVIMVAEEGTKKILALPSADPGEAWGVVVGTDQRDPLTKEQALDLVAKAFDEGDALWVVVKPKGDVRPARDLMKKRTKKA